MMLFLVLFFSYIYSASSLKVFEIEETEKLSLGLETDDPDADALTYTFTVPLDEYGEWQTTYGDAGEYTATITVSDGENEVSEEVSIIVNRKEAEPVIDDFNPREISIIIDETEDIQLKIDVFDLNKDKLTYKWSVNDEVVSNNKEFLFETDYQDAGEYKINIIISDGIFNVSKEWTVNVNNINVENILESIEDVTVLEGEKASLELPDFRKFKLAYSISNPIGNNNIWETGFDDAGDYTVNVTAEGKGFKGEKEVKITVKNKDRPPKFISLKNTVAKENQELTIQLEAVDPDNDDIIFSVEDIPENAKLEGSVFTFNPGYDFVQKNNAFDYVLDKFRLLGRSLNVAFAAQSNDLIERKNIKIWVKDVNRPFVLEDIENIEVDEGQEIFINPKYNDPDNDKVLFSYDGFMSANKKKTGFDDAGEYVVKIVATDDYFTETRFIDIKVNNVNRKPVFDIKYNYEVKEKDELRIELEAADPDNDAISFSGKNIPKGAKLKDNLFIWKPGFEVVNGTKKEFSVDFIAYDGSEKVEKKVKIIVLNVNQAPKIIEFSDNLIVLKDKSVLFEINTVDGDDDELTYSWNFGFFSKYDGSNQHQRIFTTTGSKKVEVIISDGLESVSKVWNVEVV